MFTFLYTVISSPAFDRNIKYNSNDLAQFELC